MIENYVRRTSERIQALDKKRKQVEAEKAAKSKGVQPSTSKAVEEEEEESD